MDGCAAGEGRERVSESCGGYVTRVSGAAEEQRRGLTPRAVEAARSEPRDDNLRAKHGWRVSRTGQTLDEQVTDVSKSKRQRRVDAPRRGHPSVRQLPISSPALRTRRNRRWQALYPPNYHGLG
jgi:hypothetical protein